MRTLTKNLLKLGVLERSLSSIFFTRYAYKLFTSCYRYTVLTWALKHSAWTFLWIQHTSTYSSEPNWQVFLYSAKPGCCPESLRMAWCKHIFVPSLMGLSTSLQIRQQDFRQLWYIRYVSPLSGSPNRWFHLSLSGWQHIFSHTTCFSSDEMYFMRSDVIKSLSPELDAILKRYQDRDILNQMRSQGNIKNKLLILFRNVSPVCLRAHSDLLSLGLSAFSGASWNAVWGSSQQVAGPRFDSLVRKCRGPYLKWGYIRGTCWRYKCWSADSRQSSSCGTFTSCLYFLS